MADRTSAGIFGDLFIRLRDNLSKLDNLVRRPRQEQEILRKHILEEARHIWNMTGGYDFSPQQMGVDPEDLEKLGLARKKSPQRGMFPTMDPEIDFAEDYWVYGPPDNEVEC